MSFSAHVAPDVPAAPAVNAATAIQTAPAPTTDSQKHQWTIMPNKPVEKAPPVNVVITSSDPVPPQNTATTVQSKPPHFTVTIPAQHIKSSNTAVTSTTPAQTIGSPAILAALQDKKATPNKTIEIKPAVSTSTPAQKSIFGALNKPASSSTPFSSPAKPATAPASGSDSTKPNPFAAFSFSQNTATSGATASTQKTPFASLGLIGKSADKPDSNTTSETQNQTDNVNASTEGREDEAENYEPTAHFEPVIPLPDLVEVKTGEENETTLFEHRAKLLRYVKESKEWKERGLGIMKVLVTNDDPNKVRLLMRREQVFKMCCNQMVSKDTKFNEMPKMKAALSWYGKDFSESVLTDELFIIRFKLPETCKQFHDVILAAQAKMSGASAQPSAAAAVEKPKDTKGFGDLFKPKSGSWTCKGCYTSNTPETLYCACCETPKDDTVPKKEKPSALAPAANAPKFTFGNLGAATKPVEPSPVANAAPKEAPKSGFGDQFKPKAGAWSCKGCYTSNASDTLYCACCEAPKDDTVPKKEQKSTFSSSTGAGAPKFSFGNLGAVSGSAAAAPAPTTSNAADKPFGSSTFSFSFGANAAPVTAAPATLESKDFSFVFKSKSPAKPQTPAKDGAHEDVSDDDHVEEEENTTYFTPVIPLPDKIDVKTGEENEDVLYSHRWDKEKWAYAGAFNLTCFCFSLVSGLNCSFSPIKNGVSAV